MDLLSDYSQKYLQQYAEQSFETILVRVRREKVLSSVQHYAPRRVAEIGCGLEPLFLHWKDFDRAIVVEPAAEFVANARERAAGDERLTILHGYLEDVLPQLRDADLDMIVVSSLLHEVPDPKKLLDEIRSVCAPKTIVHFNVPNVRSFHRLLALEMGAIGDLFEESGIEKRFHRHTRFDRPLFEQMVRDGGFDLIEFGTYFIKPFTHAQMEALLASGTIDMRVIAGLDRMTKYLPDMGCEMFVNVKLR